MPARGRPPKRNAAGSGASAAYKAKGGSSGKKANGGANGGVSGGGITHRARDKTRGQGARLYNDPFNDERQLEAQLKRLGLYAANTLGDGSCLFRSLSDQLHGTPNHHLTIRHEVCNFLLAHKSEFIAFIDDSHHSSQDSAFASHVAEMRNSATYGTQLEIVAFARMVTRKIKVIQAELVYVIGFEDESPSARAAREEALAKRKDFIGKGKMKELQEELPDLYIVYHNWEHYSSARNIAGPHTGLPCIIEAQLPTKEADPTITTEDIPKATQEESLILSSLRYPHRHTITEIRKLIHDSNGNWEKALESLLENEIDETESEDFNHNPSDHINSNSLSHLEGSPLTTATSIGSPLHNDDDDIDNDTNTHTSFSPPSIGIIAATPGIINSQLPSHRNHRHNPHHNNQARSSSPSASSSTATSATNGSQSTTATQLSDLVERDRKISTSTTNTASSGRKTKSSSTTRTKSSSISPSTTATNNNNNGAGGLASHLLLHSNGSSSKIRSRAASPDAEFEAAESPRQRFRLSTSVDTTNDGAASSYSSTGAGGLGGEDTQDGASTPDSSISAGFSADDQNAINPRNDAMVSESAPPTPSSSRGNTPNIISPVKSSRFPKRRDTLAASVRGPTRRQRKQAAKSGAPLGVQTRSKVSTAVQESGLQREFKELYV